MNAHSITGDGWYVGPQFSTTGEQKYSSKSIAAVVGNCWIRKGDLGFTASIASSKAANTGSKTAPFFEYIVSYGY